VTEVRALLALLEAAAQGMTPRDLLLFQSVLSLASRHLKILAPKRGEKKLIKSVAAALAKLVALSG
jgi:hypothetical protein